MQRTGELGPYTYLPGGGVLVGGPRAREVTHEQADTALRHRVTEELDGLSPAIVVTQILERARNVTEELRQRVFRTIQPGTHGFRLKRLTLRARLQVELLGQSIVLSRLKTEFLWDEEMFVHCMQSWNRLRRKQDLPGEDCALDRHVVRQIHMMCETVQMHLDLARDAFDRYYTAHNSRAIFWLTIAVLVLTAVQAGIGLDELLSWYKAIVDGIEALVSHRSPN